MATDCIGPTDSRENQVDSREKKKKTQPNPSRNKKLKPDTTQTQPNSRSKLRPEPPQCSPTRYVMFVGVGVNSSPSTIKPGRRLLRDGKRRRTEELSSRNGHLSEHARPRISSISCVQIHSRTLVRRLFRRRTTVRVPTACIALFPPWKALWTLGAPFSFG